MADYVAVLKKTLAGFNNPTPEMRQRVYERARSTIVARFDGMSPPPPASVRDLQLRALDDAVKTVERGYTPAKSADPLDELEDVFRSLNGLMNQPTTPAPKPAAPIAPITPRPAPAVEARAPLTPAPRPAPLERTPPRREPYSPPETQRPVVTPRSVTPAAPAPRLESLRTGPPQLPPVRDPSRPVPTQTPVRPTAAPASRLPPPEDDFGDFDFNSVDDEADEPSLEPVSETRPLAGPPRRAKAAPIERQQRRGWGMIAATVLGVAALGGAAYGLWINKDAFVSPPAETQAAAPAASTPPAAEAEQPATEPAAETADAPKLTQKLNEDGSEVEMGPAAGEPVIGEGTSVAAATPPDAAVAEAPPAAAPADPAVATPAEATPPETPADPAVAPADPAAPTPAPETEVAAAETPAPAAAAAPATAGQNLAVAQRAIFYEERTNTAEGSAQPGTTVWSEVQESPGAGKPPEPAIKAVVSIPDKDMGLSMTIRRNADPTLPASHIIEMIFITPEGSAEGGVDNILRVALKSDEQQPGSPVIGLPAKIGDGFFLVALNNSKPEIDANMNLLGNQKWLDIAVVYKSGRRALITMEKGLPGEKVFGDVLKAWGVQPAG